MASGFFCGHSRAGVALVQAAFCCCGAGWQAMTSSSKARKKVRLFVLCLASAAGSGSTAFRMALGTRM